LAAWAQFQASFLQAVDGNVHFRKLQAVEKTQLLKPLVGAICLQVLDDCLEVLVHDIRRHLFAPSPVDLRDCMAIPDRVVSQPRKSVEDFH
jgi:hypothetical protein